MREMGAVAAGVAGAAAPSAVSALPHFEQNLAPARLLAPQDEQQTERVAPHTSQNLLSSGISEWQLGHSTSPPIRRAVGVLFQS
jgi:hypothetical protein